MTLVSHPGQLVPWAQAGAIPADRRVLTSSDTSPGYVSGAPALGRASDNSLFNHMHALGVYALQGGAPEWVSTTDWRASGLCTYGGALYRASVAISAGGTNPSINTAWIPFGVYHEAAITTAGSGNFTVPVGCTSLHVIGMGGGGGGGGGGTYTGTNFAGGGAGGGGSTHNEMILAVTPGQVLAWSVGAGGTAGAVGSAGGGGADTTLGSYLFYGAGGGSPGAASAPFGVGTHRQRGGGTDRFVNRYPVSATTDTIITELYTITQVNLPGYGGWGGAGYATGGGSADVIVSRCGGDNEGNSGGAMGSANGWGPSGGAGGGAGSFPRANAVRLGLTNGGGGTGGSTVYLGAGSTLAAQPGQGPGAGGGGGAGQGQGTTPGSAAAAGAPGLLVIGYWTF